MKRVLIAAALTASITSQAVAADTYQDGHINNITVFEDDSHARHRLAGQL